MTFDEYKKTKDWKKWVDLCETSGVSLEKLEDTVLKLYDLTTKLMEAGKPFEEALKMAQDFYTVEDKNGR